jgi:phosphate transport system protein
MTFQKEMNALDAAISQFGGAAEDQLAKALDALTRRDAALANEVIIGDRALDEMELQIGRETAGMFARRQLMAGDLRTVLAIIKIASTIERVGDLAKNTARRSIVLSENPPLRTISAVARLGRETMMQFSDCLDAFAQRDPDMALTVWRKDEELDNLYNGLQREIVNEMSEAPAAVSQNTQLLFIAKNMERIGDHATFVAEMAYYIVTGDQIGEKRPKGVPDGSPQAMKG